MPGRVLVDISDRVAVVSLNDPDRRNALDLAFCDELRVVFDDIEKRDDVGAVVVTGRGTSFCAGADLSHLGNSQREGLLAIYEGFLRVARCPRPTIAAVNGPAVGAGVNLALACDVRIVCPSARLDTRFADLGIHPGGGHTWMLQRTAGPEAAYAMVVFGESLQGEAIVRHSLAWKCVDDEQLLDEARAMATRAAAVPDELIRRIKRTIRDMGSVTAHDAAVDRELVDQVWSVGQPAFQERLAALRDRVSSRSGES